MKREKKIDPKFKNMRLNLFSLYKIFPDGKKYHYCGTVPKKMEDDLKRVYWRNNLVLKVEPYDKENIKLWSRRK